MIAPEAVLAAAERIAGQAHHTPVLSSRTLDERTGCRIYFKCENFQRVGAFKFRGAYNAISRLSEAERAAGVITHSSGNHAQGVALAAKLLGVRAVVVMPEDAPPSKRAATEGYGARIVPCDALVREEVTAQLIREHGYTLIHPFDNDDIIAGQGTAALELFDEVGQLDYLFVPVGGGGLISGSALAAQLRSPDCRVVGVEPELGRDAGLSWREGHVVKLDAVPQTIADGLRTRAIGRRNLEIMQRYVEDMTAVSEAGILETLELIWTWLKIVVEPSAAVAPAAFLSAGYPLPPGARVGVLLSGGNIDMGAVASLVQSAGQKTAVAAPSPADKEPTPKKSGRVSRILVCTPIPDEAMDVLRSAGEVTILDDPDEEELTAAIGDYHALIINADQRINAHVIKYGYNLKAIGSLDSRVDNIDVSMARALGIQICSAPDSRAVAIAEHTVGRLLALSDRFSNGRLAGKTLGLIGFGLSGRLVAQRAAAFDMRVLVNQPRLTAELALDPAIEAVDLVDLLRESDYISLHVPFSEETEAIIGADELRLLPPTAMVVNMGHTDLIDEAALLEALESGRLAGAALSVLPPVVAHPSAESLALRANPRVIVSPHVTAVLGEQLSDASLHIARQVARELSARRASETLDLKVVPIDLVVPHEHIDMKRVSRLMERLEEDGRLVNPPITTYWKERYVILDGATRYSSLKNLHYPYAIVQVVDKDQAGFQLHTWYHAISAEDKPGAGQTFGELAARLRQIEGLRLSLLSPEEAQDALKRPGSLCYFAGREGELLLAEVLPGAAKLKVMNGIVDAYNEWGTVERTLLTDIDRLLAQFPHLVAVAIFPQFAPEEVFDAAAAGDLLPAGLTRFVIPGRILRLNADLARLKLDEPLAEKRAWFDDFLSAKLSRSRLRVYQEPVVLLDE